MLDDADADIAVIDDGAEARLGHLGVEGGDFAVSEIAAAEDDALAGCSRRERHVHDRPGVQSHAIALTSRAIVRLVTALL